MITLTKQYHIIRLLNLPAGSCSSTSSSTATALNLALARHNLRNIERQMSL